MFVGYNKHVKLQRGYRTTKPPIFRRGYFPFALSFPYRNAKSKPVNFVPASRFVIVTLVLTLALMSQFPLQKEKQISLVTWTGLYRFSHPESQNNAYATKKP